MRRDKKRRSIVPFKKKEYMMLLLFGIAEDKHVTFKKKEKGRLCPGFAISKQLRAVSFQQ